MNDTFSQANLEESTMQLIIDQVEELIVTIIEEVRQRPGVVLAIVAAIAGAVLGSMVAARVGRRRAPQAKRAVKKAKAAGLADAADLARLGLKIVRNPIVRSYLRSAVAAQLKKRFSE
jgi:uncharacterized membrane protein YeaQ/YmgE (transglycosylase-associated protein family)